MNRFEKIIESKKGINHSQRLNTTSVLNEYLNKFDNCNDDFLQLVVVSIVSSNESFFKETFSWLLEDNEEFLINCKPILNKKGIKLDIDDLIQISKKSFTIGDLIAYSLPYSSIDTIISNFNSVTKMDLYKELNSEKYVYELLSDFDYDSDEIFIERPYNLNRILKSLNETYQLRHIICHDFLSTKHKLQLNSEQIKGFLIDAIYFQNAITMHISEKLYRKQIDSHYENTLKKIDTKTKILNQLYSQIELALNTKEQKEKLQQNIKTFERYLIDDTNELGKWFQEDSIFDTLELEHKLELLIQRIQLIEKIIKYSS